MPQIYRTILEYSSNIYTFLDIFQLSTLLLLYHTIIGINHDIDFVAWLVEEPLGAMLYLISIK